MGFMPHTSTCVGSLFVNVSVTTFCLHATRARLRTQLQIKELEHVRIKKAGNFFGTCPSVGISVLVNLPASRTRAHALVKMWRVSRSA